MDWKKYENTAAYPSRPQKPYLKKDASPAEIRKHADDVEAYNTKMESYTKARKEYQEEEVRICNLFKQDALADVGLADHPKAEKIYAHAYDRGHSGGFSEIYNALIDLAELFE